MNRSKSIRVIRVTMSIAKARKIMNRVSGTVYAADPLLQDVDLCGVRDVLGKDLGYSFRRAILSGDKRQVARFCSDGWRVLGCDRAAFAPSDMAATLGQIEAFIRNAIRTAHA